MDGYLAHRLHPRRVRGVRIFTVFHCLQPLKSYKLVLENQGTLGNLDFFEVCCEAAENATFFIWAAQAHAVNIARLIEEDLHKAARQANDPKEGRVMVAGTGQRHILKRYQWPC